jgi:hypothetical protein
MGSDRDKKSRGVWDGRRLGYPKRVTKYGDSASVQAVMRTNAEQAFYEQEVAKVLF